MGKRVMLLVSVVVTLTTPFQRLLRPFRVTFKCSKPRDEYDEKAAILIFRWLLSSEVCWQKPDGTYRTIKLGFFKTIFKKTIGLVQVGKCGDICAELCNHQPCFNDFQVSENDETCTCLTDDATPVCGNNTQCDEEEGGVTCECLEGFYGDPYSGCDYVPPLGVVLPNLSNITESIFGQEFSNYSYPVFNITGWNGRVDDTVFVKELDDPLDIVEIVVNASTLLAAVETPDEDDDLEELEEIIEWIRDNEYKPTAVETIVTGVDGSSIVIIAMLVEYTNENGLQQELYIVDEPEGFEFDVVEGDRRALQIQVPSSCTPQDFLRQALEALDCEDEEKDIDDGCVSTVNSVLQIAIDVAEIRYNTAVEAADTTFKVAMTGLLIRRTVLLAKAIAKCRRLIIPPLVSSCIAYETSSYMLEYIAITISLRVARDLAFKTARAILENAIEAACSNAERVMRRCVRCEAAPSHQPVNQPTDEPQPAASPSPPNQPTPPSPTDDAEASIIGDPHIRTFDGLGYSCQAHGEVILLKSLDSPFQIQARFEPVREGTFPTVTTGAVLQAVGLPVLQLSMNAQNEVEFFVDGIESPMVNGVGYQVTNDGRTFEIILSNGIILALRRVSDFFNLFVSVPQSLTSNIVGLLGRPNSDPSDDWMTRNGTQIQVPESQEDRLYLPAYVYCTTNWCLRNASESMFTYENGTSFDDFACDAARDYNPLLELAIRDAPQCIFDACGDSVECLIDGAIGGRTVIPDGSLNRNPLIPCIAKPPKSCYFSCAEVREVTCNPTSGIVSICPTGNTLVSHDVYCDEESEDGGWMLLYSYRHVWDNPGTGPEC